MFDDVIEICKHFNNRTECCDPNRCNETGCKRHPFSLLYNLGMLGYLIAQDGNNYPVKQRFKNAEEITYCHEKDHLYINRNTLYIIHPALTKSIEYIVKRRILHFSGFILGKDIEVPQAIVRKLFVDYKAMTRDNFKLKYYK